MSEPLHVVCPHCLAVNRVPAERLGQRPLCGQCHRHLFDARSVELTAANFQAHLEKNDIPVLVEFWAPWCGYCRKMAPSFEEAAARLEPGMRLAKVNTEAEKDLAARYFVHSLPTLVLFRHGREIARQAGAMAAADIVNWAALHQ